MVSARPPARGCPPGAVWQEKATARPHQISPRTTALSAAAAGAARVSSINASAAPIGGSRNARITLPCEIPCDKHCSRGVGGSYRCAIAGLHCRDELCSRGLHSHDQLIDMIAGAENPPV